MRGKMTECFICKQTSQFYFRKQFNEFGLDKADYYKCPDCGFVYSRTHSEMDVSKWEKLNLVFHETIEAPGYVSATNQPPYIQQALMLNTLLKNDIITLDNCLDWGSGYGTLSQVLSKYFGIVIYNYDKYMMPHQNYLSSSEIARKKFKTVINSAVFEHVTHRRFLDEINSYVSGDGCFIFHTVVCEEIPKDPDWFYLLPVHCAFHTNKSMEILMKQWGYAASIYCPTAKMWVLFKNKRKDIESIVKSINAEFQTNYLYFKRGFVDYWK
jgi:2-polyprenyl-3-methyl-5-hydroxy-6-metoxy-1,4-benzoquinol methylase